MAMQLLPTIKCWWWWTDAIQQVVASLMGCGRWLVAWCGNRCATYLALLCNARPHLSFRNLGVSNVRINKKARGYTRSRSKCTRVPRLNCRRKASKIWCALLTRTHHFLPHTHTSPHHIWISMQPPSCSVVQQHTSSIPHCLDAPSLTLLLLQQPRVPLMSRPFIIITRFG